MPQPTHSFWFRLKVVTLGRYLKFSIRCKSYFGFRGRGRVGFTILLHRFVIVLVVLVLDGVIYPANADPTQATMAISRAAVCIGMALRISFSTPEGEVKGVDPVKFIAR